MTPASRASASARQRPLPLRLADWFGIGTLWGAVTHAIIAFFVMPVVEDMVVGNANWYAVAFYVRVTTMALILLDLFGWALRTGQLRIHTGLTEPVAGPEPPRANVVGAGNAKAEHPGARFHDEERTAALAELGLSDEGGMATLDDIKVAWRKAVKLHHPDRHPGNPTASARFHALNKAYQTLTR